MSRVSLTVCVCTHRRPHLARTLASLDVAARLAGQGPHGADVSVVVVDNDAEPSAEPIVTAFREAAACVATTYRHVPGHNISIARNACLDAAPGDLVAFVDDDERVEPDWLANLLAKRRETGADVVLGPVRALYPDGAPGWMRDGELHAARPVVSGGEIRTGYTCNVLMDARARALAGRRFDPARGRTGGEDTAFFAAAWRDGATIAYAPDAWVEEDVAADRLSFAWLARRRFRSGQTHAAILAERGGGAMMRTKALATAGAKLGYCLAAAALVAPLRARRNASLLRGALHAGAVASLLGRRDLALYDASASTPQGTRQVAG